MTPSVVLAGGVRKGTLTREQVIEKILRWNALYGEPPCTADWNPSLARWRAQEWRIERYRLGDPETGASWPSLNSAKRLFDGSFDAAVREAGLVPHRPGPRRRGAGGAPPAVGRRPARRWSRSARSSGRSWSRFPSRFRLLSLRRTATGPARATSRSGPPRR